jgi:hypothetical protein
MSPIVTSRRTVRPVSAERRTKLRLRELCDEVLASYRVAAGEDVLSERERGEAAQLLARIAPLPRR